MDIELKAIRKDALQHGLVLGAVLLVLDLIALYTLAYSQSVLLIALAYLVGSFIVPLVTAILLIKSLRAKVGGYWNQRQATSGIFIMFLSAHIISSLGNFVFLRFIRPQIILEAKDNLVDNLTRFFVSMKAETEKIDEIMESIEQRFAVISQDSLSVVVSNFIFSIIIIVVTALIFAAIFKRERPIVSTQADETVSS
jgi:hypothetical protein